VRKMENFPKNETGFLNWYKKLGKVTGAQGPCAKISDAPDNFP